MKNKFICPDLSDKRIKYAIQYLTESGYQLVDDYIVADFVLLGVNPDKSLLNYNLPIFAGNINGANIFDYTKVESFATKNAYLTAEGAIAEMVLNSDFSIINSSILITGYGRIGKALHNLLSSFTSNITVCARDKNQRLLAVLNNAKAIALESLTVNSNYDFVINTIPHPIFNEKELNCIQNHCLVIDLASFPGGVDKHIARLNDLDLVIARGLPSKYSPINAGIVVGQTVDEVIKEGIF